MKRLLLYSLFFAILSGCATGKRSDTSQEDLTAGELRYDGMYYREGVITQSRSYDNNYTYLRFYPDGTLIRVVTASKPDDATKWLNKKRYGRTMSKYKVRGDEISFGWKSGNDAMAYDGQVLENKLRLTVVSGSNQYSEDYFFMQMDFDGD
jgi:hypothetical protein